MMKVPVLITLNGRAVRADVEPRTLLVEFIRDVAGLTGTHIGCDTSYCGACTVLVNERAVKSCTLLAVQANGWSVRTVESLERDDTLNVLQRSFADKHALQCGFCTPGFLMAATGLLAHTPEPDEMTIRKELGGNVCRCTGYLPIIEAVQTAAKAIKERTP
ncbi:(2Fe-2S)-binding protein [Microbacteriaceae bacterium K1510]|nr:(2Fe-2S)-binding protein [Microbacteriaceae bacterium K1510]